MFFFSHSPLIKQAEVLDEGTGGNGMIFENVA